MSNTLKIASPPLILEYSDPFRGDIGALCGEVGVSSQEPYTQENDALQSSGNLLFNDPKLGDDNLSRAAAKATFFADAHFSKESKKPSPNNFSAMPGMEDEVLLNAPCASTKKTTLLKWSKEEDEILWNAWREHKEKAVSEAFANLPQRTLEACKSRLVILKRSEGNVRVEKNFNWMKADVTKLMWACEQFKKTSRRGIKQRGEREVDWVKVLDHVRVTIDKNLREHQIKAKHHKVLHEIKSNQYSKWKHAKTL